MSRILIAASRYPWPPHRGDQVRALQVAELLAAGHDVSVLVPETAPGDGTAVPANLPFRVVTYPRRPRLGAGAGLVRALLERLPLQAGLFWNPALGRALRRLAPENDLVILQLVRLAPHLIDLSGVPVLVDLVDSLALSTARRAELDRRALRPVLRLESRWLARWERRLVAESAGAMVVSQRDRDAIAQDLPMEVAGRLHVVPLAIPAAPAGPSEPPHPAGPPTLAITGNLGYFPTREGLMWLLDRVWPELRRLRPDLRLVAAGARPGRRLRLRLRAAGARLEEAPRDLRPALTRATVALAPMRGGAGQPMKVLEAWAAGVPVVATPWAAAGTTARPGEDLLVAEDVAGWCRAVLALVDDAGLRARVAAAARARLVADYSAEGVLRRLDAAVAAALHRPAGGEITASVRESSLPIPGADR
ncbi:MAG TPA: glycosyltransferase family 4 protein [Thermoanaerobaculia bacterium]|nr:glycosyltransferase family 4 protein [Thermoanaerobaculia bacterium]